MILVSNNLQKYMPIPKEAVVRINMAWIKCEEDLNIILLQNNDNKVFLDYPQGRSKPPRPTLLIETAYEMIAKHSNIKYFAVSNIEIVHKVKEIQSNILDRCEFVPKIETEAGVMNLENLIKQCNIKTIMLDKEDLFVDVEEDNTEFYKDVGLVRMICQDLKVRLLELQGVTFIGEDRGT